MGKKRVILTNHDDQVVIGTKELQVFIGGMMLVAKQLNHEGTKIEVKRGKIAAIRYEEINGGEVHLTVEGMQTDTLNSSKARSTWSSPARNLQKFKFEDAAAEEPTLSEKGRLSLSSSILNTSGNMILFPPGDMDHERLK